MAALAISTRRTRGRIFAAYQAITKIGQGGGVLIGGLLVDTIGIASTFFIFGCATLSGILLLARAPRRQASTLSPTTESKRDKPMFGLWGCALALTMTEQMVANLTGRLVADRAGAILPLSLGVTSLTGLLLGFRSLGALVLGPLTGIIGDRLEETASADSPDSPASMLHSWYRLFSYLASVGHLPPVAVRCGQRDPSPAVYTGRRSCSPPGGGTPHEPLLHLHRPRHCCRPNRRLSALRRLRILLGGNTRLDADCRSVGFTSLVRGFRDQ
jgi:MFS family permease